MIDSTISTERMTRLQTHLAQAKIDLLAIAPTVNMQYLLGFTPHADERPTYLLVTPEAVALVVPSLNADQVEQHTGRTTIRWADATGPKAALVSALAELRVKPNGVLAVDDSMRADYLILLQTMARPATSLASTDLMARLRMRKSAQELAWLAQAAALTDRAVLAGAEACRPGVSEREVAAEIDRFYRTNGAELVDFMLVAAGPNGAFPHHHSGDRKLQPGDTIIMDIGATLHGYKSDVTRVVQLGQPSEEVQRVYDLVRAANAAGRAAVKPGVPVRDIDRATRSVIEAGGYGDYFFHRTGHGLGLEVHEPPSITSENEMLLEPGMVFSVEPGIYLNGKFGIRIEDIVTVTETGGQTLTGLSHDLIIRL
jgi:Xaa-Pro aminopeptidase